MLTISVDGLNPTAIDRLGPAGAPAFHRLMREGAWTFNARTEQELTLTLPNHTGMLTGRRVDPAKGGHGVVFNDESGRTVHRAAGGYVASVFDVVHDYGGSTAMFASKAKFALFARTWNTHGGPDAVGADNGRAKIDTFVIDLDNARLVARLDRTLAAGAPTFTFLHLSLPDLAGHAHGFMGADYLNAVRATDRLLTSVLRTIGSHPVLAGRLMLLLTADHGGDGSNHDAADQLQNFQIPLIAWGPGVPTGRDLYSLNPTALADPGSARTGYGGVQPIRNGDVANLATSLLGLPTVPGSELDNPARLTVTTP